MGRASNTAAGCACALHHASHHSHSSRCQTQANAQDQRADARVVGGRVVRHRASPVLSHRGAVCGHHGLVHDPHLLRAAPRLRDAVLRRRGTLLAARAEPQPRRTSPHARALLLMHRSRSASSSPSSSRTPSSPPCWRRSSSSAPSYPSTSSSAATGTSARRTSCGRRSCCRPPSRSVRTSSQTMNTRRSASRWTTSTKVGGAIRHNSAQFRRIY